MIYFFVLILVFNLLHSVEIFIDEKQVLLRNTSLREVKTSYTKEILRYKIYWEFIPAGEAEMGIVREQLYGSDVYHIYTKTRSNKSIDLIYRVRNRTDSYVDYYGFYTLKFVKDQNEAGYISKDDVIFDHINNKWYYLLDNTTGYIPTFVQDVVSSLYWLRNQDIKIENEYKFDVWLGKVIYPMIVDVICITKVKLEQKVYDCFKVEPKVNIESFPLFKAKGRLFVYITTDKRKLPVRLESKIFIGRVFADLVETE